MFEDALLHVCELYTHTAPVCVCAPLASLSLQTLFVCLNFERSELDRVDALLKPMTLTCHHVSPNENGLFL